MAEFDRLEDFTLFLFLHMARADGSVHPNEKETIHEKMNEIFPGNHDYQPAWNKLESLHEKSGPAGAEELLKSNWLRFSSMDESMKQRIFTALFDILNANGRVDPGETQTLKSIRSWMMTP